MRKITPRTEEYMINGTKPAKAKPVYPTIRLDLSHIPEAKSWKLGNMYNIELGLKLVGLSQSRYDSSSEFEIHEIEPESSKREDKEEGNDSDDK
jgi:hypothetical protein